MQIKEFEAQTLKECLKQVRSEMGPDAVILETRKFRKGGLMGMGAHDAIAIVAATGITVDSEIRGRSEIEPLPGAETPTATESDRTSPAPSLNSSHQNTNSPARSAALLAARGAYGARTPVRRSIEGRVADTPIAEADAFAALLAPVVEPVPSTGPNRSQRPTGAALRPGTERPANTLARQIAPPNSRNEAVGGSHWIPAVDTSRLSYLERAITEIRECLIALQYEQRQSHARTVSAVVSAVAPAVTAVNAAGLAASADDLPPRFLELQAKLRAKGVAEAIVQDLFDQLPDMGAWSEQAQDALAHSAIKDLIARRVRTAGSIELTPGQPKVVALIGPTGVGKTTTVAKLAANFALLQGKRVALLTVDTYRIAAVEQLKTYSQIIGLPVSVAYDHAELPAIMDRYADFDLILIDTAGRSQQHLMQVGELKSLVDTLPCETHLVLAAQTKEEDMVDAVMRFSAARVDRLIFSKLDETSSYGTLFNVADYTGIPLSFLTTGQKVPEDIEPASGLKLSTLILS